MTRHFEPAVTPSGAAQHAVHVSLAILNEYTLCWLAMRLELCH